MNCIALQRKNITQSSTKSWLDIRMAEIDVSSTYLITGLRELVYQWDATIRRTREGGPKDDLWNMILTTDQRMRKYLSDQVRSLFQKFYPLYTVSLQPITKSVIYSYLFKISTEPQTVCMPDKS